MPLIPTIEGPRLTASRNDIRTVLGKVRIGDLVGAYMVPLREAVKGEGYQREPSQGRVKELARAIESDIVDLPTAILLSLRDFDFNEMESRENGVKMLPVGNKEKPLYVVDGQHRVQALELLHEENAKKWENYELSFVCMVGANEEQEMREFHVVNSNAKSVSTDMSFNLLTHLADLDPRFMEWLKGKGHDWKVAGQLIVDRLRQTSVWGGRIRYPNEQAGINTTIRSGALITSLKLPLARENFNYSPATQVEILEAYWEGIRRVYPIAFENGSPPLYNIQKTIGVNVFHALLPAVLPLVSPSVTEKTVYEEVLKKTLEEVTGEQRDGQEVHGVNFWRSGPDGGSGQYSSAIGHKNLTERLRRDLPRLEA